MKNNQHTKNPKDSASENDGNKSSAQQQHCKIKRILVVDDECSIRNSLQDLFLGAGYECDAAENGEEALKLLSSIDYDLILSDVMMPKMSGIVLFENVRMMNYVTNFIFITGCNIMKCDERTVEEAEGIFTKPFSFDELINQVNNLRAKKV